MTQKNLEDECMERFWEQYLVPRLVKRGEDLFPDTVDMASNACELCYFQWDTLLQYALKQNKEYCSVPELKLEFHPDDFFIGYFADATDKSSLRSHDVVAFVDAYEEKFPNEEPALHYAYDGYFEIGEYTKEGLAKRFSFDPPGHCNNRFGRIDEIWKKSDNIFRGRKMSVEYFVFHVPEPSTEQNAKKLAQTVREKRIIQNRKFDPYEYVTNEDGRTKDKYYKVIKLIKY